MNKYFVGYVTLPTISSVTDTQARKKWLAVSHNLQRICS